MHEWTEHMFSLSILVKASGLRFNLLDGIGDRCRLQCLKAVRVATAATVGLDMRWQQAGDLSRG